MSKKIRKSIVTPKIEQNKNIRIRKQKKINYVLPPNSRLKGSEKKIAQTFVFNAGKTNNVKKNEPKKVLPSKIKKYINNNSTSKVIIQSEVKPIIKKNKEVTIPFLLGKVKEKNLMKPIMTISCMVLIILLIGGGILVNHHSRFVTLNAAMEEVYISPYDPNNLLVKNQTLDDMKHKIVDHIQEFDTWYEQNIGLEEENVTKKEELLKSDKKEEEKLDEAKQIYLADLIVKNTSLKEKIAELIKTKVDYNSSEKKIVNSVNEEYNQVAQDTELKIALDNYERLVSFKKILNNNIQTAKDRIKKEKEAKEKKAKEKEEKEKKEAEEKAEEEAKSNNSSSSNSNSSSASGNFDRSYATSIYNAINSYRSSLGLAPYSYNSGKQSCVDTEAKAYASNKNPHNYLCQPIAAENAAYTYDNYSSPSDIVNAWKQDEPHHRPLKSTSYTSVAISAYRSGSYIYIEACFW